MFYLKKLYNAFDCHASNHSITEVSLHYYVTFAGLVRVSFHPLNTFATKAVLCSIVFFVFSYLKTCTLLLFFNVIHIHVCK